MNTLIEEFQRVLIFHLSLLLTRASVSVASIDYIHYIPKSICTLFQMCSL